MMITKNSILIISVVISLYSTKNYAMNMDYSTQHTYSKDDIVQEAINIHNATNAHDDAYTRARYLEKLKMFYGFNDTKIARLQYADSIRTPEEKNILLTWECIKYSAEHFQPRSEKEKELKEELSFLVSLNISKCMDLEEQFFQEGIKNSLTDSFDQVTKKLADTYL